VRPRGRRCGLPFATYRWRHPWPPPISDLESSA
jgi:hypothetical protein